MGLPIDIALAGLTLNRIILSGTAPTPTAGFQIIMLQDLTWTKLWLEFKVTIGV